MDISQSIVLLLHNVSVDFHQNGETMPKIHFPSNCIANFLMILNFMTANSSTNALMYRSDAYNAHRLSIVNNKINIEHYIKHFHT